MKTHKQQFLDEMEQVVPWKEPVAPTQPNYPEPQSAGCRLVGIKRILWIIFFSTGTGFRIRRGRRRCTTLGRCASSRASTWGAERTSDGIWSPILLHRSREFSQFSCIPQHPQASLTYSPHYSDMPSLCY